MNFYSKAPGADRPWRAGNQFYRPTHRRKSGVSFAMNRESGAKSLRLQAGLPDFILQHLIGGFQRERRTRRFGLQDQSGKLL